MYAYWFLDNVLNVANRGDSSPQINNKSFPSSLWLCIHLDCVWCESPGFEIINRRDVSVTCSRGFPFHFPFLFLCTDWLSWSAEQILGFIFNMLSQLKPHRKGAGPVPTVREVLGKTSATDGHQQTQQSFGDVGRRDVCVLSNIMELGATWLVVLNVPRKILDDVLMMWSLKIVQRPLLKWR